MPRGVEDDVGGGSSAGFNGTAVGGCRADRAESAELRILDASCTARSKPASLNEYLYFCLRTLESGVGTETNGAASCTMRLKYSSMRFAASFSRSPSDLALSDNEVGVTPS